MFELLKRWIDFGMGTTPWMYERLGGHLFGNQKLEEADRLYRKFQVKYPKNPGGILGQVKIARADKNWTLALERLEVGILKFPNHLNFYVQIINVLFLLNKPEQVKTVLEQAKVRFSSQVSFVLTDARLLQKEYAYQAAQTVLNVGAKKFPNHFELELKRGHNYWLLGNYPLAKEIFDRIRPQLDLKQGYLFVEFSTPYIGLLLRDNQLVELKQFFEEVLSANIWNQEIVFGYCKLLVSLADYQSAIDFIHRILEDDASPVKLIHQLLLLFELEKANNLQAWVQQDSLLPPPDSSSVDFVAFLDRIESKLKAHPPLENREHLIFDLFEKLRVFSANTPFLYLNTAISPNETYRVASLIIKTIQKGSSFSLIRLGDGEGTFLPYRESLQHFQQKDREISQRIWWGSVKIDENEWTKIHDMYISSLQQADMLGIPGPLRCCKTFLNIAPGQKELIPEGRGLLAIFDFLDNTWKESSTDLLSNTFPMLTSCHIHSHLEDWNLWDLILKEITNCSVISCHEALIPLLEEKHQVNVRKFHKIPSEYKYSQLFDLLDQSGIPHYPDIFEQICNELTVDYPGEVFIVAAGFLGKIYCNLIKQRGGIALDAGSAVDYWLAYKTRTWVQFPTPINFNNAS